MGTLQGRIALVTGGSRGIGRATSLRLAKEGATVAVHYGSNAAAAKEVVDAITVAGGAAFAVCADLSAKGGVEALFTALDRELRSRTGDIRFDILVNNAGIWVRGTIEEVEEAAFDRLLQVNVKAPFFITQKASPRLRDGGRIINVSSTAGRIGYPEMVAYGATKGAVESMTRSLANHFGARGITVNSVTPGATDTGMNLSLRDPVIGATVSANTALKRIGRPEDIAGVIAFLASDDARWITGTRVDASGGLKI
jgi:3-oxoacyl-[acyl-carrier protein] reductase